jgi:hypothetical protein
MGSFQRPQGNMHTYIYTYTHTRAQQIDESSWTPLHWAAFEDHKETCAHTCMHAYIHTYIHTHTNSKLMSPAGTCFIGMFPWSLKHAHIYTHAQQIDESSWTPLHWAAFKDHKETCQVNERMCMCDVYVCVSMYVRMSINAYTLLSCARVCVYMYVYM